MSEKINDVHRNVALIVIFPVVLIFFLSVPRAARSETVTVFAAASTTNVVTEIGKLFEGQKIGKLKSSFASSSTLAKQIEQGAPADVYISANKKWMDYLETKEMIEPNTRFDLLSNRIVLIAPKDSPIDNIDIYPGFDLHTLLGDGRLSMGDPDHVPAGIYGMQAFKGLGLWSSIEDRIARAKDVRAALALVERGEAPIGQVYATDAAISKKVKVIMVFPLESHPPIVYPVAIIMGRATLATVQFIEFLKDPAIKVIFEKYGFTVR